MQMQLNCMHCSKPFSVSVEQLGQTGRCPHCQQVIHLPNASVVDAEQKTANAGPPSHWRENTVSGLTSMIFHIVLLLVLALVSFGATSGEGAGEDVLIGDLPSEVLSPAQSEELSSDVPAASSAAAESTELMTVEPPIQPSTDSSAATEQFVIASPSTGGAASSSFDLGSVTIGGGSMAGESWDGLIQSLRRNGLDIVITFDSTGSMGGEIREVSSQIRRIGGTLLKLVPKARIGLVTYRDEGDDYVTKGLPLTSDLSYIDRFLTDVDADGGGDQPEAVHEGMKWAVRNNTFRPAARKIMLIFGDAPPHATYLSDCLNVASDFRGQQKGIVSTVTCRSGVRLPEFVRIAEVGGGEAFLTSDERQIMTQLLVLVFGSSYKDKVLDAFGP